MKSADSRMNGVSFVVPVHNGALWIRATLESILAAGDSRPMEIIVVDDRSTDDSSALLRRLAAIWPIRIIEGAGRGAAAAINVGVRAARFPIVCQIDQDVVLDRDWLTRIVAELDDPLVGAAQGQYTTDPDATICARVMALDLEQRYAAIRGSDTDHVCTGNAAYRVDALRNVGLFDETLGYGYDNDMSYRLRAAGYRLTFCRSARSVHRWREGVIGYAIQQYGFGYGRIDLVAKHPRRFGGDSVSPSGMMAHPIAMAFALAVGAAAMVMAASGAPWTVLAVAAGIIGTALAAERTAAGVRAAIWFRDPAALLFPILHLVRDVVWVFAIGVWCSRRALRVRSRPAHSMRGRRTRVRRAIGRHAPLLTPPASSVPGPDVSHRIVCLIPAFNEAANLPAVIDDVRRTCRDIDVLIVDDGSTDGTSEVAERLGVRWLRFPERMGIGSAMRAALRYAALLGCDIAVRIDGDGQHRANDIHRVVEPIRAGRADVVLGSRYTRRPPVRADLVRVIQRSLAFCLSALIGHRVTDPTSGFYALGPRAVRLLAEHHPTGYAEAELRLFMSRNALNVIEIPIGERSRLSGRTSLTPARMTVAGARALLAMVIVPLRGAIKGAGDD